MNAAGTVLVVDDDDVDRMALRRLLGRVDASLTVVEAGSLAEAQGLLGSRPFVCVFLDYRLPDGSGSDFLVRLRRDFGELPVIAFTSHGSADIADELMRAGATEYLDKGALSEESVRVSLRNVIRLHAAARESREAQAARAKSDSLYHTVIDALADGLLIVDGDGTVIEANPAAAAILGEGKLVGSDLAGMCEGLRHVAFTDVWSGSFEHRRAEMGDAVVIEASVVPVGIAEIGLSVVVLRDVTAARAVQRLKDEFVSTVSHELRTPVTSIFGSLRLLAGGAVGQVDAEAMGIVEVCLRNAGRLRMLLDDILDMKKIEAGEMALGFETCRLADIAARAADGVRQLAAEAGVAIAWTEPPPAVAVRADDGRLMQVMTNLLSNAVKFAPKGSTVDMTLEVTPGRCRLRVRDYGPGIPPEFAGRVFGKFQQADGSRRTSNAGTGLGLAITRAIVELHGGTIGWRNRAPGAEFWFELDVAGEPDAGKEAVHEGA